ncbi:MAG: recombinase family protein [Bauldia sp.]|nr:recombinase family protein [Bauldia sp.]
MAAYVTSQASEGWKAVETKSDDGGYSGGSRERPALQRLLADTGADKIDVVVVYRIDRPEAAEGSLSRPKTGVERTLRRTVGERGGGRETGVERSPRGMADFCGSCQFLVVPQDPATAMHGPAHRECGPLEAPVSFRLRRLETLGMAPHRECNGFNSSPIVSA